MKPWFLALCFVQIVGCGGQIVGDDAGAHSGVVTGDGSVLPPPGPCGPMQAGSTSSDGTCSVSEDWSCGDTSYHIECSCQPDMPSGNCLCSHYAADGGGSIYYTPYYLSPTSGPGCPSCALSGNVLAQRCSFPY